MDATWGWARSGGCRSQALVVVDYCCCCSSSSRRRQPRESHHIGIFSLDMHTYVQMDTHTHTHTHTAAERNAANAVAVRSVALDVPTGLRVYDEALSCGRQPPAPVRSATNRYLTVQGRSRYLLVVGIDEVEKRTPRQGTCILIGCPNTMCMYIPRLPTGRLHPRAERHMETTSVHPSHGMEEAWHFHGGMRARSGGRAAEMGTQRHMSSPTTAPPEAGWKWEAQRPRAPLDGPVQAAHRHGFRPISSLTRRAGQPASPRVSTAAWRLPGAVGPCSARGASVLAARTCAERLSLAPRVAACTCQSGGCPPAGLLANEAVP